MGQQVSNNDSCSSCHLVATVCDWMVWNGFTYMALSVSWATHLQEASRDFLTWYKGSKSSKREDKPSCLLTSVGVSKSHRGSGTGCKMKEIRGSIIPWGYSCPHLPISLPSENLSFTAHWVFQRQASCSTIINLSYKTRFGWSQYNFYWKPPHPFLLDGRHLIFSCFPSPTVWVFHPSSRVWEALSALGCYLLRYESICGMLWFFGGGSVQSPRGLATSQLLFCPSVVHPIILLGWDNLYGAV